MAKYGMESPWQNTMVELNSTRSGNFGFFRIGYFGYSDRDSSTGDQLQKMGEGTSARQKGIFSLAHWVLQKFRSYKGNLSTSDRKQIWA
uniref:Uncharacterized protein n=1 Tax=Arundo donax TaxID=35708 RepID=A0A0A9C157_ARUDO